MYAGFSSCPLFVGPGLPSPVLPDRPDLVSHGGRAGAMSTPPRKIYSVTSVTDSV